MQVQVPFGDTTIEAQLPDNTFVIPTGGSKKRLQAVEDLGAALREALAKPIGLDPIPKLVKPGSKVTIAFDDATVPCFSPVRELAIQEVLSQLESAGVDRGSVELICANALHRKFPHEELASIIGEDLVKEFGSRLTCHDAEDPDSLAYLGKTENGYDVEVHKCVLESDLLVYVTAAHNRGFSGGWKSVCVGLSTFRSIRHHHTPDGMSMSLRNNRMHMMLDEMGALVESKISGTIFKIDAVEANFFETAKIFTGTTDGARAAVVDLLEDYFPPRRSLSKEKYDVICYGVPNWSPYSIFSFMNPILTLISSGMGYLGGPIEALGKPGCTVIIATPCPERWDEVHHPSYPHVWENVLDHMHDPYEIEKTYTEQYATDEAFIAKYRNDFAFHPVHGILATGPMKRLKHAGKVIVAGIEDPSLAHHIGFESAKNIEEALEMAKEIHGAGFSIAYAQNPAASQQTKVAL